MRTKTTESQQRLEDLSKDNLLSLLHSTYQYSSFVNYHNQHDLVFLDKYEQSHRCVGKRTNGHQKQLNQSEIMKQLQDINKQNDLSLHKYHLQLIFGKFNAYYERYQQRQTQSVRAEFSKRIRKTQKEAENILPNDLVQICFEKENALAQQLKHKKTVNIRL